MGLFLSALEHSRVPIQVREILSFTRAVTEKLAGRVARMEGVSGCVLLSTCNRTELYVSSEEEQDPGRLLCAAAEPFVYEAVTATFDCGGYSFTAKGKRILSEGWREIDRIFRAFLKEKPADGDGGTIPDFTEGQIFDGAEIAVTEHFTQPPKPYTDVICYERGIRNRP